MNAMNAIRQLEDNHISALRAEIWLAERRFRILMGEAVEEGRWNRPAFHRFREKADAAAASAAAARAELAELLRN